MEVERVDFVSVPVTDMARARRFYEQALGFENLSEEGRWPEYRLGENGFLYLVDPTAIGRRFEGPHNAYIALRVADVDAARADLEARGVEFEGETIDSGVCRMALFRDPDGNALMLHRRYAPREP
ncbi:MAG TPA: VOC family protein [Gaiellaceae bacterium]|nr:VOC family protein [Gaiellaceae bacterium]